ncbi:MAG: hypothetical protein WCP16_12875 [Pseudanabaena sp. ELA645]|jgi:hypothetical protein
MIPDEAEHIHMNSDSKNLLTDYAISVKALRENSKALSQSENIFTIIDVLDSRKEAHIAILEMHCQGLSSSQVVIISKYYQEHQNSMHWEHVHLDGELLEVLMGLGINVHDALRFLDAIDDGKFLVVGLVIKREASQARHILKNIDHKEISVY